METIFSIERDARLKAWAAEICECKGSGRTVKQWCHEAGLSVKTYYYRYKQVCEALGRDFYYQENPYDGNNAVGKSTQPKERRTAAQWLPVAISPETHEPEPSTRKITIEIGHCVIMAEEGTDARWLADVAKAIRSGC